MTEPVLRGRRVELRAISSGDAHHLRQIRETPSVRRWWGSPEGTDWPLQDGSDGSTARGIWHEGRLVGFVQWYDGGDARYRHAGVDLFLDEGSQGQGLGGETVRLVVDHLLAHGHHRIVIDPAAANEAAIACYLACGFRPVGVMRQYERDVDGAGWHDGMLMEYVAEHPSGT